MKRLEVYKIYYETYEIFYICIYKVYASVLYKEAILF